MNIFSFRTLYLSLAVFGLVVISGCGPTKPVDPLQKGLIAHFAFENNVKDSSGHSYNGTANGNPSYKPGIGWGRAISLDGQNDWLKLAATKHLLNGDFTISVWVKYAKQTNNLGYAALFIQSTNSKSPYDGVSIFLKNNMLVRLDKTQELYSAENNLTDNKWHHLAMVRKAKLLSLYIDGELDKSRQVTHAQITDPSPIFIGSNHVNQKIQLYKGLIDEMRIYNRALSQAEIKSLFDELSKIG